MNLNEETSKIKNLMSITESEEKLIKEGRGYDIARKYIDNLREKVFPKLSDDELDEFMDEFAYSFGLKRI